MNTESCIRFSDEIFDTGVYVLGCGGGVIPEPRKAIYRLKQTYSLQDIHNRCLEICLLPEDERSGLKEGVWKTAQGIVYHLGNEQTLKILCNHYLTGQTPLEELHTGTSYHYLGSTETLIAGLSLKLGRELPENIVPFNQNDWQYIFCPGEAPDCFDTSKPGCRLRLLILLGLAGLGVLIFHLNTS